MRIDSLMPFVCLFPEAGAGGAAAVEGGPAPMSEGGGGGGSTPWYNDLPDDLKGHSVVTESKDLVSFAKTAIHAQSLVGKDKVVIPAKDDADGWSQVYSKLGRPESADKYQMPDDVKFNESLGVPAEVTQGFLAQAHQLGLSQRQAAGLYRWFVGDANGNYERQTTEATAQREQAVNALKQEYGQAFDERVKMAQDAVKKFGGDELAEYLNASGLGDHPSLVKAFAAVGKAMADDRLYDSGHPAGFSQRLTPAEARTEAARKMLDPEFNKAYFSKEHAGHDAAVKEIQKLYEIAHSGT